MSFLANLVKGCPLFFSRRSIEEVEEVIRACDVATLKRGEHIIHQGEESSDIAIILDGSADVIIKDQFETESDHPTCKGRPIWRACLNQ